jgi:hypothetical protein
LLKVPAWEDEAEARNAARDRYLTLCRVAAALGLPRPPGQGSQDWSAWLGEAEVWYAEAEGALEGRAGRRAADAEGEQGLPAAHEAGAGPQEPILTDADKTILRVLSDAGRALIYSAIVREAAQLVRAAGGPAARAAGLVTLGETKVRERVPILEAQGLVSRPVGPDGRPTRRKGVGITPRGAAAAGKGPASSPR